MTRNKNENCTGFTSILIIYGPYASVNRINIIKTSPRDNTVAEMTFPEGREKMSTSIFFPETHLCTVYTRRVRGNDIYTHAYLLRIQIILNTIHILTVPL